MQLFDLNARIQQLTWSLIFSEKYSTIQSYLWFWPPLILGGSVISAGTLHDLRRVKVPGTGPLWNPWYLQTLLWPSSLFCRNNIMYITTISVSQRLNILCIKFNILSSTCSPNYMRGRRCRDHMVIGFTTILCNQCLSPLTLWVRIPLRRGVIDKILCDKVCQCLMAGWWFSTGTPVSSTNKTDRHNITEILLKVALKIINLNLKL
jgi:hypothetical protein